MDKWNTRLILSCRNEIKQNFMAHSYAGDLRTEIDLREPYRSLRTMRRRVPFFKTHLKKEKNLATLSSRSSKTEK